MNKASRWESLLNDLKRQVEITKQEDGRDEDTAVIDTLTTMDILMTMSERFPKDEEDIESLYQYIHEHGHEHGIHEGMEKMELYVLFESLKLICGEEMPQDVIINMPMFKIDNPDAFFEKICKNKTYARFDIQNQIIHNIAKQMATKDDERFNEMIFDLEIREFSSIHNYLEWLYNKLSRKEIICKLLTGIPEDDLKNVLLKTDGSVVLIRN